MISIQHEGFARPGKKFPALVRKVAARIGLQGGATIRLAGVDEVRALNREYRGKDRATDVLSFALGETLPGGLYAGDVIICLPLAAEQARQSGQALERELLLLAIHGLLHLKGLDHETDGGQMLAQQERLFAEFGAKLP
jgi:probable rRNA maturation factor